jgi:carbamoyltransferase
MNIIGISAFNHDSACCLMQDGVLVAAVEEERFSRIKHDSRMPLHSFQYCLRQGGIAMSDIDCIAYYEHTTNKVARQIWSAMAAPQVRRRLNIDTHFPVDEIARCTGYDGNILCFDHHQSHAAAAQFLAGSADCAILCADGVGEWATTSYWAGDGNGPRLIRQVDFPHSIGLFYATVTGFLGFNVNGDEYKVMGLAPYGQPRYVEQLRKLIRAVDGSVELDLDYFDFLDGERMYSSALATLLGLQPRQAGQELLQAHSDLARSAQIVLEELMLDGVGFLRRALPEAKTLCLTGGVALNCVANRRLRAEGGFADTFIQPAAGDSGSCIGAACLAAQSLSGRFPLAPRAQHLFLGPAYSPDEMSQTLDALGIGAKQLAPAALATQIATCLAEGNIVGVFRGRSEFGPRALGARSILADPRHPATRDRVNHSVKQRESFRPFAPAVLETRLAHYFDFAASSPFMTETCGVLDEAGLPAITHVDGSARIQTVDARPGQHPMGDILAEFERLSACAVLLNTSFNLRGEPIVHTPEDAIRTFVHSDLDVLVLENHLVTRSDLPPALYGADKPGFSEQDPEARSTVYSFF